MMRYAAKWSVYILMLRLCYVASTVPGSADAAKRAVYEGGLSEGAATGH